MTLGLAIIVIALAFEAGAVTAYLVVDRLIVRPMKKRHDRAMKAAELAAKMTSIALSLHASATREKREAKKDGLILSPIQVKWPGQND